MALKNRVQRNIDMTHGSIYRLLITFALPLFLGDMFQQLYTMADTWVIGNFASNDEYAAVGACFHIFNLMIKTFIGLSSGAGIVIAKLYGAGDKERVRKGASTAIWIAIICSVLFTCFGNLIVPYALKASKVPEHICGYARTYLSILINLMFAQVVYNMGAGILRAVGDSRKPFLFLVIASVINVILDLYFVVVLGWGIKGVAWATAIAQCVAAVLIVIELLTTKLDVRIEKGSFEFDKAICKEMILLGIPTAIQMGITSISNVLIQSFVNGLGVNFLSGYSTYTKCEMILFMTANSMSIACMTFVSQNHGAGNIPRAKEGVKASAVITFVYMGVIGVIVLLFAPQITAFFNSEPEVIKYGTLALRLVTPFFFVQGANQIMMGALRGIGNTTMPMFMQIGFNVLFRQIAIRLVTNYIAYTPFSVLIIQPASWCVLLIAMTILSRNAIIFRKEQVPEKE